MIWWLSLCIRSSRSVFFTGVLAIVQPVSQVAAAAGVSALAASALAWRDRALWQMGDFTEWLPVMLALCGAALIAMAFANRRDVSRTPGMKLLVALAVSASLAWATVGLSGISAVDLQTDRITRRNAGGDSDARALG